MSKPTNKWYCKDLRNNVINRQNREINKLKKENEKMKNKIREKIKDLKLIDEYDAPNGWESERSYAEELLQELLEEMVE